MAVKLAEQLRLITATAVVSVLLVGSPARADHALECDKVQLPSSLVICSDPDLLAIADERAQVYRDLWARLDASQREPFKADQARWVREYATRCGVPPDVPPQLPAPPSVVECFKQAGRARIAFLRDYSSRPMGASVPVQPDVGGSNGGNFGDEIPLENSGGIYMVPVILNGFLPLPSIVDSGAADVSLPADVVMTLFRTGTIGDSDFIGEGKYRLADGSVMKSPRFFLQEVKVGNHSFNHILASVSPFESKPLLGQSFLSKVGAWSINNDRHVLVLQSSFPARQPDTSGIPSAAPLILETPQTAAFQDGLRDRTAWEQYFAGAAGDFRDGAEYWSSQRSTPHPGSCYGPAGEHSGDWTAGCLGAKRLLTPTDVRRKSEPEYRAGWNSYRG
jgi:predicted aspartyl protease